MPIPRPAQAHWSRLRHVLLVCLLAPLTTTHAQVSRLNTPDWSEQIIYFAMIDRFADGDPANNDQGAGEFNPQDGAR